MQRTLDSTFAVWVLLIAGCGVRDASAKVRFVAADCLVELGISIRKPAPVVKALLDRFDVETDVHVQGYLAEAIGHSSPKEAGYTCRVIDTIRKLAPRAPGRSTLMGKPQTLFR